jgi:hypothetical protein
VSESCSAGCSLLSRPRRSRLSSTRRGSSRPAGATGKVHRVTSALPDRLAGEIRHAVDLVAGFLDSLPGLDDPHSYLSAAEEGIEQATSVADLSAATKLTDAYHAASMGALSCALENRTETGLHAEALFIMSAVEKDARAHSDANGASTAWEKAARDLGRATRESLRRERHTAE